MDCFLVKYILYLEFEFLVIFIDAGTSHFLVVHLKGHFYTLFVISEIKTLKWSVTAHTDS